MNPSPKVAALLVASAGWIGGCGSESAVVGCAGAEACSDSGEADEEVWRIETSLRGWGSRSPRTFVEVAEDRVVVVGRALEDEDAIVGQLHDWAQGDVLVTSPLGDPSVEGEQAVAMVLDSTARIVLGMRAPGGAGRSGWLTRYDIRDPSFVEVPWAMLDPLFVSGLALGSGGRILAAVNDVGIPEVPPELRLLHESGAIVWNRVLGSDQEIKALASDSQGAIYVLTVLVDGQGVRKLDADGVELWSTSLAEVGPWGSQYLGLAARPDGSVVVRGDEAGAILVVLDPGGGVVGVRASSSSFGGRPGHALPLDLAVDGEGAVVVGGQALVEGRSVAWVAKFDPGLELRWERLLGAVEGASPSAVDAIALSPDGSVAVVGFDYDAEVRRAWLSRIPP